MRTIAAALLALALPAMAHAQFVPQTGYHGPAIDRTGNVSARPPDTGYRTPEIDARASAGAVTYGNELDLRTTELRNRTVTGRTS